MPMWPRPPAPITTAVVPGSSTGTAFLTAWIAVRPASASAAMSFGSSPGASLTTERAEVWRKSANPPSRLMPGNEPFRQCMSSPRRHGPHSPQAMNGWTITVSPTATFVTPGADLVDPAGVLVTGRVGQDDLRLLGPLPSWICRSVRHSPAAPIRTITSSGPTILGSSISSSFNAS